MLPQFLFPETTVREPGAGPMIGLGDEPGRDAHRHARCFTRIIEQESIDITIWGSADGSDWGTKPLLTFPQKFYCGTYQVLLDRGAHPDLKFLRAKWQVSRWGRGEPNPLFTVYLFAQAIQDEMALHA